jgi:monooxygenase
MKPTSAAASTQAPSTPEHVDVLIVGAGLSGIGAAHHLRERCPNKSIVLLEAREAIGGTWDLFRYPGIRSDSDMYTFGYRFRPWTGDKTLADGPSILQYIRDTAAEAGIDRLIRFGHRVVRGEWSSKTERWTIHAEASDSDQPVVLTASFVFNCSGYYRFDRGYTPDFPHLDDFAGTIVHPQHWPEDLDYAGKKVVVIGSGATAVTLVPAMAKTAGHVVMLQRSPTYVASLPATDAVAITLRNWLPETLAYRLTRWKNVARSIYIYEMSQRWPEKVKDYLRSELMAQLPDGYPVDVHFKPRYDPWDQRLCAVPDGDLFAAIREDRASVVTDTIEGFTKRGILLASGKELEADIIVTATGFTLQMLGGATLFVDGEQVVFSEHMAYKGMMLSDVPNSAFTIGYTNSSWTLKADLVSEYVCRLLNYMDTEGYTVLVPLGDPAMKGQPLLDFGAGYVRRSIEQLPQQGETWPWRLRMNYAADVLSLRFGPVDDGTMAFQ